MKDLPLCSRCAKRRCYKQRDICGTCRAEETRKDNPTIRKAYRDTYRLRIGKEAERACNKASRKKLKNAIFEHYGNRCKCCGETTPEFLTLDHVNNDGAIHRKELGTTSRVYAWVRRNGYPDTFQLLCSNCNIGRYLNGGMCPHGNGI